MPVSTPTAPPSRPTRRSARPLRSETVSLRCAERPLSIVRVPHTTTHLAICRICSAHCGVIATVTDGRLTKVTGDPGNPMFKGYTCAKGRALPAIHNNPERLLSSQKRGADGTFARIEAQQAMDE